MSLPILDISHLDDPKYERILISRWNDAFRTYGFVYLSSTHGLGPLFEDLEREALCFFTKLTPEEKLQFYLNQGYGHGAYTPPGIEHVASSRPEESMRTNALGSDNQKQHRRQVQADLVESLCSHNEQADHIPPLTISCGDIDTPYMYGNGLKHSVQKLWKGLHQLSMRVMRLSAKSLDLPKPDEYFDQFYEDEKASNFLRLAHYINSNSQNDATASAESLVKPMRYGAHTDYQGFTFLWRNQSNGLQCANSFGKNNNHSGAITKWLDVPCLQEDPHAIVVNAGDLIQRWTNNYWVSPVHRVLGGVHPENENANEKRNERNIDETSVDSELLSIVFFTGPSADTEISKLPSPIIANQDFKYDVVTAGQHLQQKIEQTSKA